MKSRSYKLSTKDAWVEEESWTVDCVCGVNFDDGEEMVNCDDCGVWVHTRCSRYVKSEESFACDKCKNRKTRNDREETEVAQLLVELPTKTLRMESSTAYTPSTLPPAPTLAPTYTRRCRLWTDMPIKERVHVQGIPGVGDNPSMFSGVSSIFGPQLWKCTGYVPKKFDFRYQDCQSWEEEEDLQKENGAVSVSRVDNTVNIFGSSNCDIPADSLGDRGVVEAKNRDGKREKLKTTEQGTNLDSPVSDVSRPHIGVRKDQILLQSSHIRPADSKENYGMLKDRSSRKKARIMENQGELKRKNLRFLGPVKALTNPRNGTKLQRHEERGPSAQKDDRQGNQVLQSSDTLPAHQMSGNPVVQQSDGHKSNSIPSKEQDLDVARNQSIGAEIAEEGNTQCPVPENSEDHRKTIVNDAVLLNSKPSRGVLSEAQVASNSHDNASRLEGRLLTGGRISSSKSGIASMDVTVNHPGNIPDSNEGIQDTCGLNVESSPVVDPILKSRETRTQCQEIYADCPTNSARFSDGAFSFPKSCIEGEDVSRDLKVDNFQRDKVDDVSPVAHPRTRHDSGGSEDCLGAKKGSKESDPKISDEPPKTSCSTVDPSLPIGESDLIVSLGSTSSITSAVSLKSHALESCTSASAKSEDINGRQRKFSESNPGSNKDYGKGLTEADQGEGSPERPKILLTKFSRSSHGSVTKTTQMKKVFHSSNSKRTFADSEPTTPSASTLPPMPTISDDPQSVRASTLGPEIASDVENKSSTLHTESASNMPKKVFSSVLPQKAEKINQPASQLSSKVNSSLTHVATSSNSTTALSDEELALLLHQELNSSPRVPRVPRMRHAGSLPQLTPSTATSMMKRTSSAVGKEHGLVPRRREKDFPKDGSHGLRDGDDETKKTVWAPPLSDQDGQDSGWNPDPVSKRELGSGSVKRSAAASAATSSSDLSNPVRATERHSLAANQSPRNPCDDDDMVVSRPPRTLPGLIAEIMSKGQRMTYEELCNTVLPHWPNLRKHNGERYAYASHSQAVLDCLRNRNEWARLVDRGPKTTGGRKRRKLDPEYPDVDSEDDDDGRNKTTRNFRSKNTESSHEEFSKGKRKVRNWTLKGRLSSRRHRRIEEFSEDEADSYVNSSEDTSASEDEIQGGVASADRADISASSAGIENI